MKRMEEVRIALWEGAGDLYPAIEEKLQDMGCRVERVATFERLWEMMERELDMVLVNCQCAPDLLHWMKGVRLAGTTAPPVLTLASARDVNIYLKTMTLGAFDCVALPIRDEELRRLVLRAVESPRAEPMLLHA